MVRRPVRALAAVWWKAVETGEGDRTGHGSHRTVTAWGADTARAPDRLYRPRLPTGPQRAPRHPRRAPRHPRRAPPHAATPAAHPVRPAAPPTDTARARPLAGRVPVPARACARSPGRPYQPPLVDGDGTGVSADQNGDLMYGSPLASGEFGSSSFRGGSVTLDSVTQGDETLKKACPL